MNEWHPFWKNLTGQIASLSERYLPEAKEKTAWLSRFLPSLNSAKKDSSNLSSSSLTPTSALKVNLVTEPEVEADLLIKPVDDDLPHEQPADADIGTEPLTKTSRKSKAKKAKNRSHLRKTKVRLQAVWRCDQAWQVSNTVSEPKKSRAKICLPKMCRQADFWQIPQPPKAKPTLSKSRVRLSSPQRLSKHWQPYQWLLLLPELVSEANVNIKHIVEAILFASNRPMTAQQIQAIFPELEQPDLNVIQQAIIAINQDYQDRPITLKALASGYRFQVKESLSPWVSRVFEEKPARYSRAMLETIAIIAYRQPVTRGDIEDIRGVSVSTGIIQGLLEREWIRVLGHKEVPGRPALFGTTKQFLDYFNLSSLTELPKLVEMTDSELNATNPESLTQASSEIRQTNLPESEENQSQSSSHAS